MAVVSEEARIRELAELIRSRCAVAQQMRQAVHSNTTSIQMAQAEETRRKLKEVITVLQDEARDCSVAGVQQRLQFTAQKLNLSCEIQRSQQSHNVSVYLSCEPYYVEVCVDETGHILSVKLVQGSHQEESSTLTNLLRTYKYATFDCHLKALSDMYAQAPSQERDKLVQVLSATEQVLLSVAQHSSHRTLYERVMLGPLGVVTPRDAGLPLKITFFLVPADLASHHSDLFTPTTTVCGVPDSVGVSADVLVERSAQLYRLSVDANLFDSVQGNFRPPQGTVAVPLTLVLVLSVKLPVCGAVMNKLHQAVYGADQNVQHLTGPHVSHLLLTEKGLTGDTSRDQHHHTVYLPGEVHHFDISIPSNPSPDARGMLLPHSKVPFLHPVQVTAIISLLRQQLLYNALMCSCFTRPSQHAACSTDQYDEMHWSVSSSPPDWISASTDLLRSSGDSHPLTVKFVIPGDTTAPLGIHVCIGDGEGLYIPHLSQVVSRCLSIPVTLRATLGHPSLLGIKAATCVQQHHQLLKQFETDIAGGLPRVGVVSSGGGHTHTTGIGVKRQRTDT